MTMLSARSDFCFLRILVPFMRFLMENRGRALVHPRWHVQQPSVSLTGVTRNLGKDTELFSAGVTLEPGPGVPCLESNAVSHLLRVFPFDSSRAFFKVACWVTGLLFLKNKGKSATSSTALGDWSLAMGSPEIESRPGSSSLLLSLQATCSDKHIAAG